MGERSEFGCWCCIHMLMDGPVSRVWKSLFRLQNVRRRWTPKSYFAFYQVLKQHVDNWFQHLRKLYRDNTWLNPMFTFIHHVSASCDVNPKSRAQNTFSSDLPGLFFWLVIFLTCQKNYFPINPTTHEHKVMKNTIMLHYGRCGINAALTWRCELESRPSGFGVFMSVTPECISNMEKKKRKLSIQCLLSSAMFQRHTR